MSFNFGQFNEFSDSVTFADPVVEAVAKAIELGPFTGKIYQAMGAPTTSLATKAFDVYSRSSTSRDGTLGGAWNASDTTNLKITSTNMTGLSIGHVIQVGSEVVVVKAVDRTNNDIDVYARGAGGTTAATHTSGASFKVIGFAGSDTDLKNVTGVTETTSKFTNYVQTVFEVIDWTKHGELMRKGLSDANATVLLIREAEIRVAKMLSRMSILGLKQQATDGTNRYMSAGLISQLNDTNRGAQRYNINGTLTEAKFISALKQGFDNGGSMDTIWCSPTVKGYLNGFKAANPTVYYTGLATDHVGGGVYIDSYNYEGVLLKIAVDADMPDDQIAVVNSQKLKKGWLDTDGLRLVDEPQASSREFRKSFQGSVGFIVEDVGSDHVSLYGITGGDSQGKYNVNIAGGTVTTISGGTASA